MIGAACRSRLPMKSPRNSPQRGKGRPLSADSGVNQPRGFSPMRPGDLTRVTIVRAGAGSANMWRPVRSGSFASEDVAGLDWCTPLRAATGRAPALCMKHVPDACARSASQDGRMAPFCWQPSLANGQPQPARLSGARGRRMPDIAADSWRSPSVFPRLAICRPERRATHILRDVVHNKPFVAFSRRSRGGS